MGGWVGGWLLKLKYISSNFWEIKGKHTKPVFLTKHAQKKTKCHMFHVENFLLKLSYYNVITLICNAELHFETV